MAADENCIFCKIVAGEIPSFTVYQDDHTVAFMDINPANPGHVLVVPRNHARTVTEIPADDMAAVARTAHRVANAVSKALAPEGLSLYQANGEAAAQSVPHLHIHVLPRRMDDALPMNWELRPGDMEAIETMADTIRAAIREAGD